MTFSEKLYQLRKARGLSQENLAGHLGVSRQAVQKWETGASTPDVGNLVAISEYFQVSLDSLLKDTGEAFVSPDNGDAETQAFDIPYRLYRPHYEYKSKRTLFGLPLVHINLGRGFYRAKGIIAIGNIAVGLISLGIISAGILSVGCISAGILVLAALGIGAFVFAAVAVGILAVGGVAAGLFAVGGFSVGIYSLGGCAIASRVAIGGYANAHIAVGDQVSGFIEIAGQRQMHMLTGSQFREIILGEFPGTPSVIMKILTLSFRH